MVGSVAPFAPASVVSVAGLVSFTEKGGVEGGASQLRIEAIRLRPTATGAMPRFTARP